MSRAAPFGAAPVDAVLADGRRHFQHGPIDLVIEAYGAGHEVRFAYEQAWARFETILGELVDELPLLRAPLGQADGQRPKGPVARRMAAACARHADRFVTPMAAVAGAVADEVLEALAAGRVLQKAYVNNGGDVALHLRPGASFDTGMVSLAETPEAVGKISVQSTSPVRGIATSGWRGRSLSLGIADAVTVLARNAAEADAAATLIANEVNVEHRVIDRVPAFELDPDSDLGERLVTVEVGDLPMSAIGGALTAGAGAAQSMVADGRIIAAHLVLQRQVQTLGAPSSLNAIIHDKESAAA